MNGTVILRDNIPEGVTEDYLFYKRQLLKSNIENGGWDDFIKPVGLNDPPRFPRIQSSSEMPLEGNVYVPITIKAIHSVHNSLMEDGNSWVYVYWQSSMIRKQIIPQQFL